MNLQWFRNSTGVGPTPPPRAGSQFCMVRPRGVNGRALEGRPGGRRQNVPSTITPRGCTTSRAAAGSGLASSSAPRAKSTVK